MGRVNTDNTTISVTNNTINHLNSGYGIDLGFAAFADTIQTIDVMNNIINSSNKGLRVSFLKNGATVNILKNIITVNDGENNYNMVLSTSSKADNLRDYSPRLYVTNNSFKGNVKIGITVKGDKVTTSTFVDDVDLLDKHEFPIFGYYGANRNIKDIENIYNTYDKKARNYNPSLFYQKKTTYF